MAKQPEMPKDHHRFVPARAQASGTYPPHLREFANRKVKPSVRKVAARSAAGPKKP